MISLNIFLNSQIKFWILKSKLCDHECADLEKTASKIAKSTGNCEGATIYCTHAPCTECSKLIIQSGITRVVYKYNHKHKSNLLNKIITVNDYSNLEKRFE